LAVVHTNRPPSEKAAAGEVQTRHYTVPMPHARAISRLPPQRCAKNL
jgi:hypothetical protein